MSQYSDELNLSSRVYNSFQRICGGGIKARNANKCKCQSSFLKRFASDTPLSEKGDEGPGCLVQDVPINNSWLAHLRDLAEKSMSYPNGPLKTSIQHQHRHHAHGQKMADDDTNVGKPHDVEIRLALSFFHRYRHKCQALHARPKKQKKKKKIQEDLKLEEMDGEQEPPRRPDSDQVMPLLEIISDLGLVRRIHTPHELALLIVRDMEDILWYERTSTCTSMPTSQEDDHDENDELENERRRQLSLEHINTAGINMDMYMYSIKVDSSGIICMVTPPRFQFLKSIGRLPCSQFHCTKWLKTEKGLRWHEQLEHNIEYSEATAVASSSVGINELSIVPYLGPASLDLAASSTSAHITKKRQYNGNPVEVHEYSQVHSEKKEDNVYFQTIKDGNLEQFISLLYGNGNCSYGDHEEKEDKDGIYEERTKLKAKIQSAASTKYNVITYLDKNGASALHWAAGCGHLPIVQYLIEEQNCPPDQPQRGKSKRSFRNRTPLHWSSRNGHLHIVRYLVEECGTDKVHADTSLGTGIDIDATTIDGTTAFCWACWQGHDEIMKYLYEQGADVHRVNSFGCNAVLWAAQSSSSSASPDTNKNTNTLSQISWLASIGLDVSLVNSNGHGVLHKSAQRGNLDVCQWMFARCGYEDEDDCESHSEGGTERACAEATSFSSSSKCLEVLRLMGPDAENYCPSDVAGMEGFTTLAKYLAQQEKRVALEAYDYVLTSTFTSTSQGQDHGHGQRHEHDLPSWLKDGLTQHRNLAKNTSVLDSAFEKGAGIKRMCVHILQHPHSTS